MGVTFSAVQQVNSFFEKFAEALQGYDTKTMAFLYHMPCTLLSDDATTLFNDYTQLEGFFNQGASIYRQMGVAIVKHEIWNKHNWTEKIVNAKVKWYYFDAENNPIYNCEYQYVLKTDKHSQLKIIMSVSINERKQMEDWKRRQKLPAGVL